MRFPDYSRRVFVAQIFIPFVCKNCGSVSFEAPENGTVYDLTKRIYGIVDSEKYGPRFVVGIGEEMRVNGQSWTYLVNGFMPPYPANKKENPVAKGDVVEWRRV